MNKKGFTLVEIMIVVAIIGLLAAIAIPSFMKSRTVSQANACINNLRQIESAKEQWAMSTGRADGYTVTAPDRAGAGGIDSYIRGGSPSCPLDADNVGYDYQDIGANATCPVNDGVGNYATYTLDPAHELPSATAEVPAGT